LRFLLMLVLLLAAMSSSTRGQQQPQTQPLGIIGLSRNAFIDNAEASVGDSVFSGDSLSTRENGNLQLRVGSVSLYLGVSSAAHIYRAPYGAVVELNRGAAVYVTSAGKEKLVIVALDIHVTPDVSEPDIGIVSIENPCEVSVYSRRGQVSVQLTEDSHVVGRGEAYRIHAENKITYREYLSPEASDYHRHHVHEPCAAKSTAHNQYPKAPIEPGHFERSVIPGIAILDGFLIRKALESPDRP
jgi:hypothetical protein